MSICQPIYLSRGVQNTHDPILPQYHVNQDTCKPTGHIKRYGLTAVDPILTALLLSSLNDLQLFVVFLYALFEFSCTKRYR